MAKNRKHAILLILLSFIAVSVPAGAEEMLTLVVRPELLRANDRVNHTEALPRNIFSWPQKTTSKRSQQERAEDLAMERLRNLRVEAILWDGVSPLGIINGQLVGEGEQFEGIQVLDIRKDSITVQLQNVRHTLHLQMTGIHFGTGGNTQGN